MQEFEVDDEELSKPDLLVGQTIDNRYFVEKRLGEGGMGLVYRVRHKILNQPLAMKVLRAEVSNQPEIIARFQREAQSASAIGNPHIIDIRDFGVMPEGSTYFIMEYLDGDDLTSAMEKRGSIPEPEAIYIIRQLAEALAAAHAQGIVHRDLKPDNIFLVDREGHKDFVKVLDFGIAKMAGASKNLTKAGEVFGTPHYMSPEQCSGAPVDQRTDIYALGVILYEMVSGRVPFDSDTLMGVLTQHLYENPIPPRQLDPPVNVSPGVESIVLRCLAKKVDQRYPNAEELIHDLDRIDESFSPNAVSQSHARISSEHLPTERMPATRMSQGFDLDGGRGTGGFHLTDDDRRKKSFVPTGPAAGISIAVLLLLLAGGSGAAWYFLAGPGRSVVADPQAAAPIQPHADTAEEAVEEPEIIEITTDPPGAEVWVGENWLGKAPVQVERPEEGGTVEVSVRMEGYDQYRFVVGQQTDEEVRVNLTQTVTGEDSPDEPRDTTAHTAKK